MHAHFFSLLRSQRRAFTMLEVMVATLILAIGISAALDAIFNNNNLRRSLDERTMADLVLRQMTAQIKSASIDSLGLPASLDSLGNPIPNWAQHRRVTSVPGVPAATLGGTLKPLTQDDLIIAGILREKILLDEMSVYVEYYNLMTNTGLVPARSGLGLVQGENGLLKLFNNLQRDRPTASPLTLWYSIVGDPDTSRNTGNVASPPSPPTEPRAQELIMPAAFDISRVNAPGTPEQVLGAFNHGLVIRVLVSWRPGEMVSTQSPYRMWRETLIVKRN